MPRFARTIRFDDSDGRVFPKGAGADEWAVSGAVVFAGAAAEQVVGKQKQAFANGFLSADSLGWSTFVTVAEASDDDLEAVTEILAKAFLSQFGAPDTKAAQSAAQSEVADMLSLCADLPINTLFAVTREFDDDGEIRETIRTVSAPGEKPHTRIWDVVPD
ncbi:MAG: hypothetical protein E2O93_01600 [Alphaproteobacteria bacterium]|nr:MAG: hypothetical protein E2O93_01600 [Alphaproteobacteria bacterium]